MMAPSTTGANMITRDEQALHQMPKHTLAEYVYAWELAGDLELIPELTEQDATMERMARK